MHKSFQPATIFSKFAMFACSVLSFLIFFPSFCLCVGTPPRSPTPVSLDLLNFDDYKNAFLDPNQAERSPSPKRMHYVGTSQVHQQNSVKDVNKAKVEDVQTHSNKGKSRIQKDEQRALAPRERKKKKAFDEDVDFVVKQSSKKKANQRKKLVLGNAKKSDKKRKISNTDSSSSWSM